MKNKKNYLLIKFSNKESVTNSKKFINLRLFKNLNLEINLWKIIANVSSEGRIKLDFFELLFSLSLSPKSANPNPSSSKFDEIISSLISFSLNLSSW